MMCLPALFWGLALVAVGALLLASNLGLIPANAWGVLWPSLVILLGLWLLSGQLLRGRAALQHASVPLEGASRARVRLTHGAGRLDLYAGVPSPADLLAGDFGGGVQITARCQAGLMETSLSVPPPSFPGWKWGGDRLDWSLGLARGIPLALELHTGANQACLDLSELLVSELSFSSGASSTHITFPANAGLTHARLETGAASVTITVPAGVAGRIRAAGGLLTISVDEGRFPRTGGGYQSPDYDRAANKLDLEIQAGVGTVTVA